MGHTTGSIASDIADEYSEDYEASGTDMRQPSGVLGRPPRPGRQQSTFRYCAPCVCCLRYRHCNRLGIKTGLTGTEFSHAGSVIDDIEESLSQRRLGTSGGRSQSVVTEEVPSGERSGSRPSSAAAQRRQPQHSSGSMPGTEPGYSEDFEPAGHSRPTPTKSDRARPPPSSKLPRLPLPGMRCKFHRLPLPGLCVVLASCRQDGKASRERLRAVLCIAERSSVLTAETSEAGGITSELSVLSADLEQKQAELQRALRRKEREVREQERRYGLVWRCRDSGVQVKWPENGRLSRVVAPHRRQWYALTFVAYRAKLLAKQAAVEEMERKLAELEKRQAGAAAVPASGSGRRPSQPVSRRAAARESSEVQSEYSEGELLGTDASLVPLPHLSAYRAGLSR